MQVKLYCNLLGLFIISIVSLSLTSKYQQKQSSSGNELYMKYCTRCHGSTGEKVRGTIKSLKLSTQPDFEIINIITTGRGKMPAFKNKISAENMELIKEYIKTLRK